MPIYSRVLQLTMHQYCRGTTAPRLHQQQQGTPRTSSISRGCDGATSAGLEAAAAAAAAAVLPCHPLHLAAAYSSCVCNRCQVLSAPCQHCAGCHPARVPLVPPLVTSCGSGVCLSAAAGPGAAAWADVNTLLPGTAGRTPCCSPASCCPQPPALQVCCSRQAPGAAAWCDTLTVCHACCRAQPAEVSRPRAPYQARVC
jgi:hypothetical protein